MNQAGLTFAFLTTISWAICVFPFTQAARRWGAPTLNLFRLMIASLLLFIVLNVLGHGDTGVLFSSSSLNAWLWLGISGVVGLSIGDHFGFITYSILGARLGSVLSTFAPGAALITGYLLTDDRLSWIGITGMMTTVFGVAVLSLSRSERNSAQQPKGSVTRGIIFGLISAFCQGAGLVLAKKGMSGSSPELTPVHATFIRISTAMLVLLVITVVRGRWRTVMRPVFTNENQGLYPSLMGTFFGPVVGVSLSLFTVARLEASIAQTIFSLVPVLVLLISRLIFKEQIRGKSMAGVLVAVAGVIILVWRLQIEQLLFSSH